MRMGSLSKMEMHTRSAILLPEEPFGVQLLRREYEQQVKLAQSVQKTRRRRVAGKHGDQKHDVPTSADIRNSIKHYVREGASMIGGDSCIEEVAVLGHRVAWTSGSAVRKLFTLGAEVLQAAWAVFPGHSNDPVLSLLCANCCLITCTVGGEMQESAVPPGLDAMWPAGNCGILLGGPRAVTLYLLSHPMIEPQPVVADVSLRAGRRGSYAGWSGEQVVWSSYELPYLATYSEAAGRLAIWTVGSAPLAPEVLGNLPDIPAATPLGAAPVSAAKAMAGPAGCVGRAPSTGISIATAATPASMMSMFSFKPHVLAGPGEPSAVGQAAASSRQPHRESSHTVRPPAQQGALVTPPVAGNGGGGGVFQVSQQSSRVLHQPIPYGPPSAAPSDMSMAMSPAVTAVATPMMTLGASGQQRPPLPRPHSQQQHHLQHGFLQQQPSSFDPPSAAPSKMSIGYTPTSMHVDIPQMRQPQPQQPPLHAQQVDQRSSPDCPPTVPPSDMSMSVSMSIGSGRIASRAAELGPIAATPATQGGTAAAATSSLSSLPGSLFGRYYSPYNGCVGGGGPSPMLMSPWMPTASPGPGFAGASATGPGLKRIPATRTPEGFLSPHLFNPMPRATAGAAAASPGGYGYATSAISPVQPLSHYAHLLGSRHEHSQRRSVGTPFSQFLGGTAGGGSGSGAGVTAAPASTPGMLGATLGGRLGSLTHLTVAPRSGYGDSAECTVMVLLHEETLQPGCRPTEAVMATDLHGEPLLCVLCGQQSRVLAFSISIPSSAAASAPMSLPDHKPTAGGIAGGAATVAAGAAAAATSGGRVRVSLAGSLEAVAIAAVAATGLTITSPSSPFRVHRDLLTLLPSGQLLLHRGLSPLFAVSFGDLGALEPARGGGAAASVSAKQPRHTNPTASAAAAVASGVRNVFGSSANPSTPASAAGADMVLDDDSDFDQDDNDECVGGGSSEAAAASRHGASGARAGAGAGFSAATRADEAMNEATDDDDIMLFSSPPTAALASWKYPPGSVAASLVKHGGVVSTTATAVPATVPQGLRRGVNNTIVLVLSVPPGEDRDGPLGDPVDSKHRSLKVTPTQMPPTIQPKERELRLLLPFMTTSAAANLALEVIRTAAPAELYLTFLRRFYTYRPAPTRHATGEWAAVDAVLLEWASDPPAFTDAGRAAAAGVRVQPSQQGRRSSGGCGSGYGGGYGATPATPVATPLHTRRFAAMSLASPVVPQHHHYQQQQQHHHHHHHRQQQQRHVRHQHLTMQRALQQQPVESWVEAVGARRGVGDGLPAGAAPGSAWERLLASETQARLMSSRRKLAWMTARDPGIPATTATSAGPTGRQLSGIHTLLGGGGSSAAAVNATTVNTSANEDASTAFPAPPLGPAAQPLLVVLYGLHGLYEELKLDVLSWPLLQPLGISLAAVASMLGLHSYWEHYARDLGPATLVAAGAPEPPLQGPQGLSIRQPSDVYRILGRMVSGTAPEPPELPSLLDPGLTAAAGTAAVGAARAGKTMGSGSAAGTGSGPVVATILPPPFHPVLPLTSRLLACYGLLAECARSCAAILLDTSLQPQKASPGVAAVNSAVQLEAAVRTASEQVVALVVAQNWDAGSLGRLPPGVALPLREAFQRCRASPTPGWPVQAYALIGREDIAATLAPSGLSASGPAATADKRQQEHLHIQNHNQQQLQPPHDTHLQQPSSPQQQQQQQLGQGVAATIEGTSHSALSGSSFVSLLRHLPGLRTSHPGVEAQQGTLVTPTSVTNVDGAARIRESGPKEENVSTVVGGGGVGTTTPSSLFSFRQLPHLSFAAVTPSNSITPHGPLGRRALVATRSSLSYVPSGSSGDGNGAATSTPARDAGTGSAAVPCRPLPPPPPPRPPPSYLWHMWRPAYTARLQLPSHQLDLGAELEAPRKLEGPAKQFESKHGMEGLTRGVSRLRFGRDSRLRDVISALDSSHPLVLDGLGLHESDPDAPMKQQQQLLAAALRTMSLPLGRGAVALATGRPLPTEPTAAVPSMCLAGLVPDSLTGHTVVNLDLSTAQPAPGGGAAADFTAWPEFHNGAAEGLRLSAGGGESLSRTWLHVTTKPDVPSYTHAGLLMALGLTGHLDRLSWTDLYRYLSDEHDPTTIAVLVGMAAQRRASMDPTVTRMLFLHLPARHPTTFPELELSPLVQAAALMGVGLLYEGSAHRVMAETLVEEIGRRPLSPAAAAAFAADGQGGGGPGGSGLGGGSVPGGASLPPGASLLAVTHEREGYALAAGLALGMVVLGLGGSRAAAGLADLQLEERLTYYMLGSTDASAAARRAGGLSGALGGGHFYAGGSSGLDRVFGPGRGGAKLGHAAALWGGDPAGPAALNTPAAARLGDSASVGAVGNGQGAALVVLEPDNMLNLSITSPAATVALALMYLRTNNAAIASRFQLPDTPFGLDCVRPDCITLRALGRALVMWNAIEPSEDWLETSMPPLLRSPLERLVDRVVGQLHGVAMGGTTGRARGVGDGLRGGGGSYHSSDVHAVALAHVSALSGLCLAIGLKYAGSANSRAYETLRSVALALLAAKRRLPEVAASSTASGGAAVVTGAGQVSGGGVAAVGRLDRAPVEAALSVVVLALSVVMAGTGHLPTFHLLQALSNRRHPTHHHVLHSLGVGYGAHCAVSLSLGFLFLGAGTHTFSTTNSAVAALLVALFPTLPHTPTDNRCHLQVFRHLYVLAARQRCLEAVDIDSQQLVYVPLQLTVTPPRVASPALSALAAVTARGNGPTGHDNSADGGTNGDGITGCDPMLEDNTILKASTKANLPWSPDSHLRPGPAGAPVIMGTGAAAGATANGAPGSPPMLEALHLEGDSPGLASLLRATTATATTTAGTTGAPVNAAVPKPSPGSIVAMGSPRVPDYIRAGTSSAAVPPFINMACGLASTATGQPAAVQSQQPAVANGQVMTYERVAPALLPEPHQTIRVAVRGPRYWPQQLDWSSRRGTAVDDTVATASYNMAASASAAPFGRGNAVSSGAPPTAHAAGALGASVPPQTPYGQFPFATPLQGGGAWAGYLNLAGLRTATPPTSVVPAPMATSSPQAATARNIFHNVTRGVLAPTAAAAGGCSALETVYRQLLLFVKKRAGSLSYSQDPSGIRSLLSRAFHNQGLLRMPLELPPPCAGTRSHTAVVTGGAATPLNVAGGAGVSPSSGGNAVFGARRQLDWCTDHRSDRRAAPLGSYFSPCRGGHGGGGSGGVFMEPPSHEGHFDQDQYRADHEDYFTDGSGSGAGNAARTAARGTATVIGNGNRTRGGGGFDLVHLCATFSVDPSIMAFAQHIKAMRDLWSAVEADAEVAIGTGCVTAGGLRRGIVLLAPVSATLPAWDTDVEQQRQLLQWQHCQRRRHGAGLLSFCYSALYECITGEKTAALPMYLNLHCLVHRAASWSSPCASGQGQCHPIEEGLGGPSNPVMGAEGPMHPGSLLTEAQVPLTIALRGLQLARAYYSGPLAAAAAAAAAAPAGDVLTDLDEQALWRPLMQPAFLDSLWCTLQHRRWRPMGLLPSQGATSNIASSGAAVAMAAGRVGGSSDSSRSGRSSSALEVYMRRGRTLQGVDFDSVVPGLTQLASEAELQAELAACLSLHSLPPLATVVDALSQLRALPAWQQLQGMLQPSTAGGAGTIRPVGQVAGAGGMQSAGDGGMGVRSSWALLPLLSLVMPGVSNEGLLLLATAITT